MIPTGPGEDAPLSFTVPGVVAALNSMLEKYGTKSLGEILEPAIHYADDGFPNYEYMLQRIGDQSIRDQFALFPAGGEEIFFDDGNVPEPGTLLIQKNLAMMLKQMVTSEDSRNGSRDQGIQAATDEFYQGNIAASIVDFSTKVGGILEANDLASYVPKYGKPCKTTFLGHEIHGHSTWTQGIMTFQALNILENFNLKGLGHNSPDYIHIVIEALKLCFADRDAYYGDPDYVTVPIDGLLSKKYAAEQAKRIDPKSAYPELPLPGDPWKYSQSDAPSERTQTPEQGKVKTGPTGNATGTTHISCIDAQGINYIVTKDDVPVMTFGCPGGDHQAQANTQLILNSLLFGMNPQESVEAPRFATESVPDSFYPHSYYPNRVSLEEGFPSEITSALKEKGHGEIVRTATCGMGATISRREPTTGVMSTSGDPRRSCYALGW